MSTAVSTFIVAGLLGLACSSSGLKSSAGDAGTASGGQAGNTMSNGVTGDTGGAIGFGGPNGSGGTAGGSGTVGRGGQGPICASYRMCNQGDQQVGMDSGDQQVGMDCPAERECYTLSLSCGSGQYNTTTCVLPVGVHCDDPLLCNPGDTQTTFGDQGWIGCADRNSCYQLNLCAHFIMCRYGADAGVDANSSDARMDPDAPNAGVDGRTMRSCGNGILEPAYGEKCDDGNANNGDGCNAICQIEAGWQCPVPGQLCIPCGTGTTNVCDAGPVGYCGDGIIQPNLGEECDLGPLNGMHLDQNGDPTDAGGCPFCSDCIIPLCVL
jgi:cysteine-rich repeat protein